MIEWKDIGHLPRSGGSTVSTTWKRVPGSFDQTGQIASYSARILRTASSNAPMSPRFARHSSVMNEWCAIIPGVVVSPMTISLNSASRGSVFMTI